MTLLILLLVAAVIGYLLAQSRYREQIDAAAGRVETTSLSWAERAEGWWQMKVMGRPAADPFRTWAAQEDDPKLPVDFRKWLASLDDEGLTEFVQSLDGYAKGLGYSLTKLASKGYDEDLATKKALVNTIVVYSKEYRKARPEEPVNSESPSSKKVQETEEAPVEQKPAKRQPSRRKRAS